MPVRLSTRLQSSAPKLGPSVFAMLQIISVGLLLRRSLHARLLSVSEVHRLQMTFALASTSSRRSHGSAQGTIVTGTHPSAPGRLPPGVTNRNTFVQPL